MNTLARVLSRTAVLISFTVAVFSYAQAEALHPNDVARYLAGLEPSASSPLAKYAKQKMWKRHAAAFEKAFQRVNAQKLNEARNWASLHLTKSSPNMYYMFSGPDFLWAATFYPNATNYVLTGLEPVGAVPGVGALRSGGNLAGLRQSMSSVLNYSFFITKHMKTQLRSGLKGTLPVIFVFMARTGHTIKDVSFVKLDGKGGVVPYSKGKRSGLKINFSKGGKDKTLYYFSTDLANHGIRKSGLREFTQKMGKGDALVKSASYLMHLNAFSNVREFILNQSQTLVQDDSGIPVKYFKKGQWNLRPFGRYAGPIPLFKEKYQRDLAKFFKANKPEKVKFGIGYRWRTHETNILLAKKK